MISFLKQLVKKSRWTHALAKEARNHLLPHYRVLDMAAAWNTQAYSGNDPELCFALFRKNKEYQEKLAATMCARAGARKYLGAEWVSNIGTLANLDAYVKARLLGWSPPREAILAAYPEIVANPFYLNLWKEHFSIVNDADALRRRFKEIVLLADYHLVFEMQGRIYFFPNAAAVVQKEWEEQGRLPLLQLNEETIERGWRTLAGIGMPRGAWFVALHVRENGFKAGEHQGCLRNCRIASYLPALQKIVRQGGWVIRCGNSSMTPLPPMERVFDYALSPLRCDWLDIFLASQCRFFIGTQSGLSHVPETFGTPALYTNWLSLGFPPYHKTNVFIPKIVWHQKERRAATLRELVQAKLDFVQVPHHFAARGMEIIDNTPEDIAAGVGQMLTETGSSCRQPDDQQGCIKQAYADLGLVLNGRVSDVFLSKHAHVFAAAAHHAA